MSSGSHRIETMTDPTPTPDRPPLWRVMYDARIAQTSKGWCTTREAIAAEIRALADAVVPEEPEPRQQDMTEEEFWQYDPSPRHERQRIRALLLTEAQRAEEGE